MPDKVNLSPNARLIKPRRIAIFGGSFNPPGQHHYQIAKKLTESFDWVIIYPCGLRPDKTSANILALEHRQTMVAAAFSGLPKTTVDLTDLEYNQFTRTHELQERFQKRFPHDQIWHVVGGDIVAGGRNGNSEIHRVWQHGQELWRSLNFAVIVRPGYEMRDDDLPPSAELLEFEYLCGSGTMIRQLIRDQQPVNGLLDPAVWQYIQQHRLYQENIKEVIHE